MTDAWNIAFPVKQQAPGKRRYREHGGKLCSKCGLEPPRKGGRYGKRCHALYEQVRRAAAKDQKARGAGDENQGS